MFNLDEQIKAWRLRLTAAGITSAEVLAELECHLRDDIERQVRSGASETDAFKSAVEQLGHAAVLREEFAKANETAALKTRATLTKLCLLFAGVFILMGGLHFSLATLEPGQRTLGYFMTGVLAVYLGSLPWFLGRRPIPTHTPGQIMVLGARTLAWICAGVLLMVQVMPALGLASQYLNVMLWAAMSIVSVFAWLAHTVTDTGHPPAGNPGDTLQPILLTSPPAGPFTPRVRQALDSAREEAAHWHHDFVGTEHVLLGLLKPEDEMVVRVLKKLGVDEEAVRSEIARFVGVGPSIPAGQATPFTPRVLKAFKLAVREANLLKHAQVGPEHVLLGLLREGEGVAARVLKNLKLDLKTTREQILSELKSRPNNAVS